MSRSAAAESRPQLLGRLSVFCPYVVPDQPPPQGAPLKKPDFIVSTWGQSELVTPVAALITQRRQKARPIRVMSRSLRPGLKGYEVVFDEVRGTYGLAIDSVFIGYAKHFLVGGGPFIINRFSGEIRVVGSAHTREDIAKYEATLTPAILAMAPEPHKKV